METQSLPTFFVPHGSPMFALNPGLAGQRLSLATREMQAPRAIVIFSPHWETTQPVVGTALRPATIYDFHGFDPRLYSLAYPASGAPDAAACVVNALKAAGFEVERDAQRGLDHGAWIPLMHMFPEANIPVIPVSIQPHGGPLHAHQVGQALQHLRHEGFLIIGSGNLTHNLSDWHRAAIRSDPMPSYVRQFSDWIADRLTCGDIPSLLNYRQLAPSSIRSHPTDEHLLPFFIALGAAGDNPKPETIHRGIDEVVLAMDAYRFH